MNAHVPHGRKAYLHQRPDEPGSRAWESKNDDPKLNDQKCKAAPVKANKEFSFCVRFDNLSAVELGLLLFALEPEAAFHHKIGMGKSIGLGSVKLSIQRIERVDRIGRYSLQGLRGGRASDWSSSEWQQLRQQVIASDLIPRAVLNAIRLLGNYNNSPIASEVHVPLVPGGHPEMETYKWFVENDDRKNAANRKYLQALDSLDALPEIDE